MVLSAEVTCRTVSLTVQDPITGWYAKTFVDSTIDMSIQPKGSSFGAMGHGFYAKYDLTGFTADVVFEDDEIIDTALNYYRVLRVDEVWLLDSFSHRMCSLMKMPMRVGDQPTTSGTWHLDSDATTTDPRSRMKVWLTAYLTPANILEDDAAMPAAYIIQFDNPEYNLKRVFQTKSVDLVFSVGKVTGKAKEDYLHKPYAFEETVPITVAAINKTGLTAANVVEQAEQEIRHCATDYPLGASPYSNIRSIESVKHEPVDLGGVFMWSTTVTIKYMRPNDEYVPTAPSFAETIGHTYDGDRLSGGAEGTWTLNVHGSTATHSINSDNNLVLNITNYAADVDTETATAGSNLGLDTNIYTRIRFRYKTSVGTTCGIAVTGPAYTQFPLLMTESSTAWSVGDVALTAGKTLDHLHVYCGTANGTVYLDFIQIYRSAYILPNVTHMSPPFNLQDAIIPIPGRSGSINQPLGSECIGITMTCDLDMEHSNLTWKRSQTGAKTDVNKIDVLLEMTQEFGSDAQYPWTWLDLGDPAMQFKARLFKMTPDFTGEGNKVELLWGEIRSGSAANETTSERFGLTL